jgi:hypothetical protein
MDFVGGGMPQERGKRTVTTHDAIVSAYIKQKWEPVYLFFRRQPSFLRYIEFLLLCTLLNGIGLLIAQQSSSSMFYLDSIGTALASLLGGLSAGIATALASAVVGSVVIGHAEHNLSAFANIGSALVWAVLPRLGTRQVGVDIFHPSRKNGYFRKINQVFFVGLIAGIAASLCSFAAQFSFFKLDIELNNQTISAISSGSYVSKNNFVLVAIITERMGWNYSNLAYQFVFLASSASAHIPDKIISTSLASIIAMGFMKIPRYRKQVGFINRGLIPVDEVFNSPYLKIISYVFFCMFIWWIYAFGARMFPSFSNEFIIERNGIIFVCFFGVLLVSLSLARKSAITSVDPYMQHPLLNRMFYDRDLLFSPMTFQRDVFEDSIKLITIIFSLAQFVAFSSSVGISEVNANSPGVRNVNLLIDGIYVDTTIPSISNMVAYNILLLTGMRYGMVAVMRYFGRF